MNKLIENGKRLPFAAKTLAVSSFKEFVDNYPIVGQIKPEHWDFVLTIAGIVVGVSQINNENIPDQTIDTILENVSVAAIEIYTNSIDACDDCRNFVDRTYDRLAKEADCQNNKQYLFADSLGAWVVWNLFGHAPLNEDERKLVRIVGVFLVHSFISWWK
jgi:hypothetical protein